MITTHLNSGICLFKKTECPCNLIGYDRDSQSERLNMLSSPEIILSHPMETLLGLNQLRVRASYNVFYLLVGIRTRVISIHDVFKHLFNTILKSLFFNPKHGGTKL